MADIDNSADALRAVLGSKIVSYQAIFAKAFGSVPAAVFLSQGFFWQENAQHKDLKTIEGKSFFDKTIAEWYDATGITEEQQKTARELLRGMNILLECRVGVPARLHYHIDFSALVAVIYRYKETGRPVAVDNRSKKREITRASSGKFRRLEAVNSGDIIESIENLESIDIKKEKKRAQTGEEYIAMLEAQNKEIDRAAAAARKSHTLMESIELAEGWIKTNSEELKKWCALAKYSGTPAELMNDVSKFFSHHRKGKEDIHEVKSNPLRFFQDGFLYWMIDSVKMKNTGASKHTPAPAASSIPTKTRIL